MTRFGWIISLGIALCIAAIAGATWFLSVGRGTVTPPTETLETAEIDPTSLAIYTSGTYGFTFFYPATAVLTDAFSSPSIQELPWRENATDGTLVVRIEMETGEVRIGASAAGKDVAACLKASPAERILEDMAVGSTTWNTFAFDKLGTDTELQVVSYRTVHEDACIALETFEPLAATSSPAVIQTVLQSFTFVSAQ